MTQHALIIKMTRNRRSTGNPLRSYDDPPPRTSLPFHPPYPPAGPEPNGLKELNRHTRGI